MESKPTDLHHASPFIPSDNRVTGSLSPPSLPNSGRDVCSSRPPADHIQPTNNVSVTCTVLRLRSTVGSVSPLPAQRCHHAHPSPWSSIYPPSQGLFVLSASRPWHTASVCSYIAAPATQEHRTSHLTPAFGLSLFPPGQQPRHITPRFPLVAKAKEEKALELQASHCSLKK